MSKLSLKIRLALGSGLLLFLLVLCGGFDYYAGKRLVSSAEEVNSALKTKELAISIENTVRKQIRAANDYTFTGEEAAIQRYDQAKQESTQLIAEIRRELVPKLAGRCWRKSNRALIACPLLLIGRSRYDDKAVPTNPQTWPSASPHKKP